MAISAVTENPEAFFNGVLGSAARVPLVRIDRNPYLRAALARHCSDEQIRRALEETPAAAGVPLEVLDEVAADSIKYETAKVAALSAAAGIPGGLAVLGTVPADMVLCPHDPNSAKARLLV